MPGGSLSTSTVWCEWNVYHALASVTQHWLRELFLTNVKYTLVEIQQKKADGYKFRSQKILHFCTVVAPLNILPIATYLTPSIKFFLMRSYSTAPCLYSPHPGVCRSVWTAEDRLVRVFSFSTCRFRVYYGLFPCANPNPSVPLPTCYLSGSL